MKKTLFILFLLISFSGFSQNTEDITPEKYTAHNKGKIFIAFGGNRDYFTKSDIHFKGNNFDFTINDAEAHDKPKGWHIDYINPTRFTIPQTNMRFGYFISDHYAVSLSIDHMKYIFTPKCVKQSLVPVIFMIFCCHGYAQTTETFSTGSFIINMGATPGNTRSFTSRSRNR